MTQFLATNSCSFIIILLEKARAYSINFLDSSFWQNKVLAPFCILAITDWISWSPLAYERNFVVHNFILVVIFYTRGSQSLSVNLLVTKGTPRYLTGSFLSLNPICCWISKKSSLLTPIENNSHFVQLIWNRDVITISRSIWKTKQNMESPPIFFV